MQEFDNERIRERMHTQWRRRLWFVAHAVTFVVVFVVTTFALRGFRPLIILLALWALGVALHAVAFYFLEERDISIERALEAKRRRMEANTTTYTLGSDGEILPRDDAGDNRDDDPDDDQDDDERRGSRGRFRG